MENAEDYTWGRIWEWYQQWSLGYISQESQGSVHVGRGLFGEWQKGLKSVTDQWTDKLMD